MEERNVAKECQTIYEFLSHVLVTTVKGRFRLFYSMTVVNLWL